MKKYTEFEDVMLPMQDLDPALAFTTSLVTLSECLCECIMDNQKLLDRVRFLENNLLFLEAKILALEIEKRTA
ncbi:MAG: hypothetical protein MH252_03835 [Thermosynechococcaceae cyanobacterium MS004]|nr:hypothetical protein [Thermosynechococcaceae cyanobacterium MS004]